ncbi:MAG TPA: thiamine-phosphate kinase [Pseudomonadales bacterium]|nr:thiamine-phosphate kinase [Pseudomonadales bacterium]
MPALGEFELIQRYFTPSLSSTSYKLPENISIGVGDDCAVLKMPANAELAISVDTQVAGVHFHADADPSLIAARALRCAASDLAAMGAEPLGFTLALTLPSADENWLEKFSSGLLQTAQQLRCPLIGGDTTRGPLCISIQVHGSVPSGKALRRGGAKTGDDIWVSGTLGDGAAALALMEKRMTTSNAAADYLWQRFYHPDIDFSLGVRLRDIASSCIDVSDGLLADLDHICKASGVGARIESVALPIATVWHDSVSVEQAQQWALTGGDDYRLCFTAAPQHAIVLQSVQGVRCIGRIVEGVDILVDDAKMMNSGFRHF